MQTEYFLPFVSTRFSCRRLSANASRNEELDDITRSKWIEPCSVARGQVAGLIVGKQRWVAVILAMRRFGCHVWARSSGGIDRSNSSDAFEEGRHDAGAAPVGNGRADYGIFRTDLSRRCLHAVEERRSVPAVRSPCMTSLKHAPLSSLARILHAAAVGTARRKIWRVRRRHRDDRNMHSAFVCCVGSKTRTGTGTTLFVFLKPAHGVGVLQTGANRDSARSSLPTDHPGVRP